MNSVESYLLHSCTKVYKICLFVGALPFLRIAYLCMVAKSGLLQGGSLHGKFVDATPFKSSVKKANGEPESGSDSLVDELGCMLKSRGFNYHGTEVLYSGIYGTELTCEIFIGPVYYQRLRHMVSDKYQVRLLL